MELFPAQPDLSLQISPPNSKPKPSWSRTEEEKNLGFWNSISSMAKPGFDLSLSNPRISNHPDPNTPHFHHHHNHNHNHHHQQQPQNCNSNFTLHHQNQVFQQPAGGLSPELGFLRPIRGIPIYQNYPSNSHFPLAQEVLSTPLSSPSTNDNSSSNHNSTPFQPHHHGIMRSRFLSRFPGKRNMRAPRMRWTSTLHARFIHAVELLGGHERATPKSVLELMDVKDLTLAHVKSHLQMYRTVKTTDRPAASSGQSDLLENGSSGDNSEDVMFEIRNTRRSELSSEEGRSNVHQDHKDYHALWSNSSRETWLHGKPKECGGNISSLEKDIMDSKCLSYDRISEVSSSSLSPSETTPKKPNLEFTLGRPH
ncbi:hypothetical protein LguiB_028504 [Lonicera macranthoides]